MTMSLNQKIEYLTNNGYIQEGEGVDRTYISNDKSKRFTIRDLMLCWHSLQIF